MSGNERKTKPNKGKQDQVETSAYINQIINQTTKSKEPLDATEKEKVQTVKAVTNWPDEDILLVLEKCNNDTQLAINQIVDGKIFGYYHQQQKNEKPTKL